MDKSCAVMLASATGLVHVVFYSSVCLVIVSQQFDSSRTVVSESHAPVLCMSYAREIPDVAQTC